MHKDEVNFINQINYNKAGNNHYVTTQAVCEHDECCNRTYCPSKCDSYGCNIWIHI